MQEKIKQRSKRLGCYYPTPPPHPEPPRKPAQKKKHSVRRDVKWPCLEKITRLPGKNEARVRKLHGRLWDGCQLLEDVSQDSKRFFGKFWYNMCPLSRSF